VRIFLYESLTGGGLLDEAAPSESLLVEGRAMIAALAEDFHAVAGVQVAVLRDRRVDVSFPNGVIVREVATIAEREAALVELSRASDWTIVIAPESDRLLARTCRQVVASGGRLLGPTVELVELASDKQATNARLKQAGVSVPDGFLYTPGESFDWGRMTSEDRPMVVKPNDGAGSQGVCLVKSEQELRAALAAASSPRRVEHFCPGKPASVVLLCGPAGCTALPACEQLLSDDGRFVYQGGRTPLSIEQDLRARRLACRAIESLGGAGGYLGVDLILGDDPEGGHDVVVEINPRLTTSYVGLRAACRWNLAEAMLRAAEGSPIDLKFDERPIQFTPDGRVGRE
jgi:hypothetical protein